MQKLEYIDALRGWAIVGVLMVHCSQFGYNSYPLSIQNMMMNGARGVQLFYVISSFTLFLSFTYRYNTEAKPNFNYFIRRYFRIAPMYYVGVVYYLLQLRINTPTNSLPIENISFLGILSNIFFIHGFYPYWMNIVVPVGWSVAVEVQFYCLVPIIYRYVKTLNQAVQLLLLSIILNLFITTVFIKYTNGQTDSIWKDFLYFYLPNQLPVFVCGIIMFFISTEPRSNLKLDKKLLLLFCILFLVDIGSGKNIIFSDMLLFSFTFVLIGYMLSFKKYNIFVNSIVTHLGKISYSIYIVHFAVLYWMEKYNLINFVDSSIMYSTLLNFCVRFILLLSINLLICSISYKYIELPFQNIGKRIININEERLLSKSIPEI